MNDQSDLNENKDNDPIAGLMQNALVEMPFSDFDHRMMVSISREARTLSQTKRDKNRASLFFMLGCFSGLCLSVIIGTRHAEFTFSNGGVLWKVTGVVFFCLLVKNGYTQLVSPGQRFFLRK